MLSEDEFAELTDWSTVNENSRDALIAHDREQRAEIERLVSRIRRLRCELKKTRQERDRQLGLREAEQRKWGETRTSLILQASKRNGSRAILHRAEEAEAEVARLEVAVSALRDSARVRDARYIGAIEALLHGVDEYWEEHDGRETVLDAIRLVEESKP